VASRQGKVGTRGVARLDTCNFIVPFWKATTYNPSALVFLTGGHMSKSLSVVALVLLVLSGAMGLRNAAASVSVSSTPAHATFGNGPHPAPLPGGGITFGNGPHPAPLPGGGITFGNGPHPAPLPGGGITFGNGPHPAPLPGGGIS